MSSGCWPRSLIIDEEILPGFDSDIKVIALLSPIENKSSIDSNLADLFEHLRYGPNLPILIVISSFKSGCLPNILGSEHKYFALSKSTSSIGRAFGIETIFIFSLSLSFFYLPRIFVFSNSNSSSSYSKYGPNLPFFKKMSFPLSFLPINLGSDRNDCWDALAFDKGLVNLHSG